MKRKDTSRKQGLPGKGRFQEKKRKKKELLARL